MYDIIVIGAGIIGSFIAHQLARYDVKVLVLEKNREVCSGVSKANSAIIHSGYDPEPHTLKAILNRQGNQMYDELCKELNVSIKNLGSLTIATNEDEVNILKSLYERAQKNKVKVKIINRDDLIRLEPNLNDDVVLGLFAESTKIISPWEVVYALLENAVYNEVELKTSCEVMDINTYDDYFEVKTSNETFKTKMIINASGLYAQKIEAMVTEKSSFEMIFSKGQYFVLDKEVRNFVNHVIYPVPSEKGKGVLIVPTIEGNILVGPTSQIISSNKQFETVKEDETYIKLHARRLMKNIPFHKVIHTFTGIRPKCSRHDFVIEESHVPNFINVAGIDSPGLASAPAIAQKVMEIVKSKRMLKEKLNYQVYAQKKIELNHLSIEKRNDWIKLNPSYGKIVCRCEEISEGEVLDAIRSLVGVKTIDGVKRRSRAGMGRCQGGFCQSKIVDLLSKELNILKTEVLLNEEGSNLLIQETKTGGLYD